MGTGRRRVPRLMTRRTRTTRKSKTNDGRPLASCLQSAGIVHMSAQGLVVTSAIRADIDGDGEVGVSVWSLPSPTQWTRGASLVRKSKKKKKKKKKKNFLSFDTTA